MDWKIKITTCALGLSLLASPLSVSANSFSDIKSTHWAYPEINYLVQRDYISGYSDGTFGANRQITRAEAAVMIMRYFGWTNPEAPNPGFTDLSKDHWAYDKILTLYTLGIFTPQGNKFEPSKPVTRAEMADMLVKTFELSSIKGTVFTDVTRSHWAYQSINILAGSNITSGYPDGTFRPDAPVTRAEFSVFMSRALDDSFQLEDAEPGYEGIIYDLEINDEIFTLDDPLRLTDRWLAPLELFERMGYQVQSRSANHYVLENLKGQSFELSTKQDEIWIGNTSVELNDPLVLVDGVPYVKAHEILETLQSPLVFYPDEFVIRLEEPKITSQKIIAAVPSTSIDVIHDALPFWHWNKRDRDHLALIKKQGTTAYKNQLLTEMSDLMDAYYSTEKERKSIRGLTFYGNMTSGKLDAISRGIEARYLLLYAPEEYEYPGIAKSLPGSLNSDRYTSVYSIHDYTFEDIYTNDQRLWNEIQSNTTLPMEQLSGLEINDIPYTITEIDGNNRNSYAGIASGAHSMFVVNSSISTFYHEFGHNWDSLYGDEQKYLALRGKSSYRPVSNAWENRVGENFAEDFTFAFMPESYGKPHFKAIFGEPSDQQIERVRQFVKERTPSSASEYNEGLLNGAMKIPDVIYSKDGKLHIEGSTGHNAFATITNLKTGEEIVIDFATSFDTTISLPDKGIYKANLGGISTIVVYE